MNESKLNKFVVQQANDLISAKKSMSLSLAISAVHFKMATLAGQMRVGFDIKAGFGKATSNFYGLSFSPSGSGKSISVNLLDGFYYSEAWKYMKDTVYPKYKAKALEKLESEENERKLHAWSPKLGDATSSGLSAYAESYYLAGVAGIAIQIDELAEALTSKSDLFKILLECYNNGDFLATAKRSDSEAMDIQGMPISLYTFGDASKLTSGDNLEHSFHQLLRTGYARRMIFSNDDAVQVNKRSADDIVAEMRAGEEIKNKRSSDRERIKNLICRSNMDKTLYLEDEAFYEYARIQAESEGLAKDGRGLDDAVKADLLNRTFKVVKLASLYAFFDGNEKITKINMEEAYEVIKDSSKVLARIMKIKPTHLRLLEKMLEEDRPFTAQHLLQYPFINSTWTKKIVEYVELAKELASEKGYIWKEVSKKNVTYYTVKKKDVEVEVELKKVDTIEAEEVVAIERATKRTKQQQLELLGLE